MWRGQQEHKQEADAEEGSAPGPVGYRSDPSGAPTYPQVVHRHQNPDDDDDDDDRDGPLHYDPISLKEPEDLHSWNWCGPFQCLQVMLHKTVKEVDGRDQHVAVWWWVMVVMGFSLYGVFLFLERVNQRAKPPQAFTFLHEPNDLAPIQLLPYMMFCPLINYRDVDPRQYPIDVAIQVVSKGWITEPQPPARMDERNITWAQVTDFLKPPKDPSACQMKGCFYFDGPTYSQNFKPNLTMTLDQRWVAFTMTLRMPENVSSKWNAMSMMVYAGVEDPDTACLSDHIRPFMSSIVLQKRLPDRREFRSERVRLKFWLMEKLKRKYHLTEKRRYHPDDFYEMMHVGSDYIQHVQKSDSQEADVPGTVVYAGGISFRIAPMIMSYKELEPVDVLAIVGTIAGIWTAFLLIFKLAFPENASGKRRIIKPLRSLVSKTLPRRKSRTLRDFEQVLGTEPQGTFAAPKAEEKERAAEEASVDNRSVLYRRFSLLGLIDRRGSTRQARQDSSHLSTASQRSAASSHPLVEELELPGPEERLLHLEQVMRLLVHEMKRMKKETKKERRQAGGGAGDEGLGTPSPVGSPAGRTDRVFDTPNGSEGGMLTRGFSSRF